MVPAFDVALLDRHLHDDARLGMDRQERRIGRRALLAQRRQHDRHHRVVARSIFSSVASKRPDV
jgi:hypothetical protein